MIPVILAADGLPNEVDLVSLAPSAGMRVMRRPVDAAELLAAAACDRTMPVVLAASLPRVSRDVMQRVLADGRPVVGLRLDRPSQERLLELGLAQVVDASVEPGEVVRAVAEILQRSQSTPGSLGEPDRGGLPDRSARRGRLIAVWGPPGAPGRTVTAIGLSEALSGLRERTFTIDADLQAPALGLHLGIREDVSGIVVVCRHAEHGSLDERSLRSAAREVGPRWSVLTGIGRPEHSSHVRAESLAAVLDRSVSVFDATVVDLTSALPDDDSDLLGAGRDSVASTVLGAADDLIVVTRADPLGVARLLNSWQEVRAASPLARPQILLTHAERSEVGSIRGALCRAGITDPVHVILRDTRAYARCLAAGATLGESARRSKARSALAVLARSIVMMPPNAEDAGSAE